MRARDPFSRKYLSIFLVALLSFTVTSCSSNSQSSEEKKPSVRETRWLAACRAESFSLKCRDAIAAYEAKNSMFYSLANSKVDYEELLTRALGPHNVWCYVEEGKCYLTIHAFNNSGSPYLSNPTAMITDGNFKFHYAVLDGSVSFDGFLTSKPLETDHFFDLNPGQESFRNLSSNEVWRAGFNIPSSRMQNLQKLSIGKATETGAFSPDGPGIPFCKKSNSTADLIIYEDCRILNEWDYVNGEYQKKIATSSETKVDSKPSIVVAGESCEKAGLRSNINGKTFTCIKLGEKLYWDNGKTNNKNNSSSSKIGTTGPGGGVIFYDAGSEKSWGRYLEAAAADVKTTVWCEPVDENILLVGASGVSIGSGRRNTNVMLESCTGGAAISANSYNGGGLKDWYLPSKMELAELFKQRGSFRGLKCTYYWSSSESSIPNAWRYFYDNRVIVEPVDKGIYPACIRPIRAIKG